MGSFSYSIVLMGVHIRNQRKMMPQFAIRLYELQEQQPLQPKIIIFTRRQQLCSKIRTTLVSILRQKSYFQKNTSFLTERSKKIRLPKLDGEIEVCRSRDSKRKDFFAATRPNGIGLTAIGTVMTNFINHAKEIDIEIENIIDSS